jgi:hypothetical protein
MIKHRRDDSRNCDRRSKEWLNIQKDSEVENLAGVSLGTARIWRLLGFCFVNEGPVRDVIIFQYLWEVGERRRNDRRGKNQDFLMSDSQVGKLAGVSTNTVRYWRQMGVLPFVKVGRHPRIWHSIFQKVFQKPLPFGLAADTMPSAGGDIRRDL